MTTHLHPINPMTPTLEQLGLIGIIPVVVIEDEANAEPLAQALLDGGLSTMEVTFRTAAAKNAMTRIAKAYPMMLLGAGTVLTVDQVKTAVNCGAQYIVSPGLSRNVIEYCMQNGIAVTPGVATPTEIEAALDLGLQVVKFFPAEANGGLEYLKAISAPFKQMKFIPTGGIDEANLLPYLKFPQVLACGGSWMVKADLISNKRFDDVKRLTEQAVAKMLGFQLSHVGINNPDANEAAQGASLLSRLLQLPIKDGNSSMFVGTQFELLKRQYLGKHGHIAVGTNFIERAITYFAQKGIGVKEETKVEKGGRLATVYLDTDVGGFAVHLLQM